MFQMDNSKISTHRQVCLIVAILVSLLAFGGCNSTPQDSVDQYLYEADILIVRDLAANYGVKVVKLDRNETSFTSAEVVLAEDTLPLSGGLYRRTGDAASVPVAGAFTASIIDSSVFGDTLVLTMPADFSIVTNGLPDNRINPAGAAVNVDWEGVANASGYVLAAVPRDSSYKAQGYSEWVSSITSGLVPPDAFRWSNGIDVDTGWYDIFVYTYNGSPDDSLSSDYLPVPLPSDLGNSINVPPLQGRYGGIVVAAPESVHVVTQ